MTIGEGLLILFLALATLCQIEEIVDAYHDRTKAMLRIAGIIEMEPSSRLWMWIKTRILSITKTKKEAGG
jgi:hypothetical protein